MPTKVVLGLQYGDEGKGKVVDQLVENWADVVVRFQGGDNAGHTIYDEVGEKYVLHSLPTGVLKSNVQNVISRGCVVNPINIMKEIKKLCLTPALAPKCNTVVTFSKISDSLSNVSSFDKSR